MTKKNKDIKIPKIVSITYKWKNSWYELDFKKLEKENEHKPKSNK